MINQSVQEGDIHASFELPRLDIMNSSELLQLLSDALEETGSKLYLDCSELEFIDSAVLGVLVRLHNLAEKSGKKLIFTNLSKYVQSMFSNTKMDKLFNIE